MKSLCVFCGSSPGRDPAHAEAARALGALVARRGLTLVYGGGKVGLMGALADAALVAGARVVGVIPQSLVDKEVAHEGLAELRVVGSMHERKALMAELSDAFVALPGGIGTLEELFETWTWGQLGLHAKPYGLLDAGGFYEALLAHLDRSVAEGFLRDEHRAMLAVSRDAEALLDELARRRPPSQTKWIGRDET